jgi:hypothetical protein
MDAVLGVTAMDTRVITVSVDDPEMLGLETAVAVMVVVPVLTGVASPAASTVATLVLELDQVTGMEAVVLSEYVAVAVKVWFADKRIVSGSGVTAMDTSVTTVSEAALDMEGFDTAAAVMVVVPMPTGVAVPALFTVATAGFELVQVTDSVPVVLSEYVIVAVKA